MWVCEAVSDCVLCSRHSRGWTPCRWGQQGPALEPGLNAFGSREGTTVPMIPLGLKETKELDWSTALKVSAGL